MHTLLPLLFLIFASHNTNAMSNDQRLQQHNLQSPVKKQDVLDTYSYSVGWQETRRENPIPLSPSKAVADLIIKAKTRIKYIQSKFEMNPAVHRDCKNIYTGLRNISTSSPAKKANFRNNDATVLHQALSLAAAAAQIEHQTKPNDTSVIEVSSQLQNRIRSVRRSLAENPDFLVEVKEENKIENMFARTQSSQSSQDNSRLSQRLQAIEEDKENIKLKEQPKALSGKKRKEPTPSISQKNIERSRKRICNKNEKAAKGTPKITGFFQPSNR